MNINNNSNELCYTEDGDFLIDNKGRLETSTYRKNNLLKELVARRMTEVVYGFNSIYSIHSNLSAYLGLPNPNVIIDELKKEILRTLTTFNFLTERDISFGSSFRDDGVVIITLAVRGSDPNIDHIELGLIIDSRTNTFKVQFANEKEF